VAEHTFHAFNHLLPLFGAPIRRPILPTTCLPRGTLCQDTLTVILRDVLMGLVPLYIYIYIYTQDKQDKQLTYFHTVRISTWTLFSILVQPFSARDCYLQMARFYDSIIFEKHYSSSLQLLP